MNIWFRSILIGVGVAILTYVLVYKKGPDTYKGYYIIRVKEYENVIPADKPTIERVADNLQTKMAANDIKAEVKILNDQLIDLSFSNLKSPYWVPHLTGSQAQLEFRELYTQKELTKAFSKFDTILGYAKPAPAIPKDENTRDTGGLATFTEGYTSEPEATKMSIFKFLIPPNPYVGEDKKTILPPHIGAVLIRDTAFINSILHQREILNILPIDVKFLYGEVIEWNHKGKSEDYVELYAVRSLPGQPALINNSSITKAILEDDYDGKPAINLEFNAVAAKRWEKMTTDNVGNSIAIILDNRVISAPRVNGPIAGENTVISGGLSKKQARDLVDQLNAGSIPATITIVKEEFTKEREAFLSGNLLLYLVILLVASTISYLIFRLLGRNKSNPLNRIDLRNNPTP